MCDINDGLVDVILEVTPTEENKWRGIESKKRERAKEEWRKRRNTKYRKSIDQDMKEKHVIQAHN